MSNPSTRVRHRVSAHWRDGFTASSRQPSRFPKCKWAFHTCEPSSWRPWPRDGVHARPPQQSFQAFFFASWFSRLPLQKLWRLTRVLIDSPRVRQGSIDRLKVLPAPGVPPYDIFPRHVMPTLPHTRCHAPQRELGGLEPQEHDFPLFAKSRIGAQVRPRLREERSAVRHTPLAVRQADNHRRGFCATKNTS
jgi:hypothetical protein